MRKVVFVQGGGIGLDQEASVRRLFDAIDAPVEFEVHVAGRAALEQARDALPRDTFEAVNACGVALKTKLLQPKGAGMPTAHGPTVPTNYNVAFRRGLGLFASVRPVTTCPESRRFSGVNFLPRSRNHGRPLYCERARDRSRSCAEFQDRDRGRVPALLPFCFDRSRNLKPQDDPLYPQGQHPEDGRWALDCFRTVAAEFPTCAEGTDCRQHLHAAVSKPQQFGNAGRGQSLRRFARTLGQASLWRELHQRQSTTANAARLQAVYGASHENVLPDTGQSTPADPSGHRVAQRPR